MAKQKAGVKPKGNLKNFEERLKKLEDLGEKIKESGLPLEEALKAFEEGIALSRSLEEDLKEAEGRIEILMNSATEEVQDRETKAELGLFDD